MKIKYLIIISFSILFTNCNNESQAKVDTVKIIKIDEASGKISGKKMGYNFESKKADNLNTKGIEKIKSEKIDEALELFMKAKKIEKTNPVILSNIGLAYQKQGEYEKAVEFVNNAISYSDSSYVPAIINLSNIYLDMNKFYESKKLSKWALVNTDDLSTKSGINLNLILANVRLGDCESAKINLYDLKEIEKTTKQRQLVKYGEERIKNCK